MQSYMEIGIGLVVIAEWREQSLADKVEYVDRERVDRRMRKESLVRLQEKGIDTGEQIEIIIQGKGQIGVLGKYNPDTGRFALKGIPNQPGISGIRLLKLLEPPSD